MVLSIPPMFDSSNCFEFFNYYVVRVNKGRTIFIQKNMFAKVSIAHFYFRNIASYSSYLYFHGVNF